MVYGLIIIILSALMFFTRQSNKIWADEETYCRRWLAQVPFYKSVKFYLAGALLRKNELQLARDYYLQALEDKDWE